jgi:hypothetical protein
MNPRKLKKQVKRLTAKKRAERQTARRNDRISSIRDNTRIAPDIYGSPQATAGRRNRGAYKLKKYDYDMFEYGDPVKSGRGLPPAHPVGRRQMGSRSHAKREQKRDIKKEQKRKALWGQNIKLLKEGRKKANRLRRKKRRAEEVKGTGRPTSRKLKNG